MKNNSYDKYFLFSKFPLSDEIYVMLNHSSIKLADGIYLKRTPREAIRRAVPHDVGEAENIVISEMIYPGFNLLGMPVLNACIMVEASIPQELQDKAFWHAISALFLVNPLHFQITGSFHYGNETDGFVLNPSSLNYKTNISLNSIQQNGQLLYPQTDKLNYAIRDIEDARLLCAKIKIIYENQSIHKRMFTSLNNFLQGVLWEQLNYSSSIFAKLFICIDSLSGNPSDKHRDKISERVAGFLNNENNNRKYLEDKQMIAGVWDRHRHATLHGFYQEAEPGFTAKSQELIDLYFLMNVNRLALMKFLNLDSDQYKTYCERKPEIFFKDFVAVSSAMIL